MSSSRNRLAQESSPYLQQHASNPVDWYPWSPEALERAREEQLPILLSIGYSSCHWCHVMERESFANDDIAALMNEGFVNIKVDREERPDLDQIYQGALQALGGQGGWPLTVFLTPELEPFFGGTYFPPVPRHGLNSFPQVLQGISAVWNQRRDDVFSSAQQLVKVLGELENPEISSTSLPEKEKVIRSAKALAQRFDHEHGGFGNRPKFPGSMNLELWLRLADEEGGEAFVDRVFFSLLKMVQGGIHDHVGGGFHRYSVDERWLIPHFEKMLYDNGLLLSLLARLQRLRPDELWQDTAQRLVEWLFREMRSPQGAFYSAQDADSEGAEGTFFVWNQEELAELLGVEDGRIISELMGVIPGGNFERGKSVLHQAKSAEEVAAGLGIEVAQVESAWKRARGLLLEAREKRPKPFRDEKILVGWNGLAIRGLAEAGRVFAEEDWIAAAVKASDFIHEQMWLEGRLQRVFMAGSVRIPAFADDYALLAEGELALYEATGDSRHFDRSQQLVDQALELFACPDGGAFFLSPKDGEPLVQRPRAIWDNSTPSATSALCHALLRLHALSGEGRYADHAESSLAALSGQALAQPFGFGHLLGAALSAQKGVGVLVLMERDEEEDASGADDSASGSESLELTEKLWKAALNFSAPDVMVLRASPAQKLPPALATLLEGNVEERPALYFCRQGSCSLPVREVEKISSLFSGN